MESEKKALKKRIHCVGKMQIVSVIKQVVYINMSELPRLKEKKLFQHAKAACLAHISGLLAATGSCVFTRQQLLGTVSN